jgi:hypothetical protein
MGKKDAKRDEKKDWRLLLLADTHVGDRIRALEPKLLEAMVAEQPDLILHAGDIAVPAVVTELEKIAPVLAVQGNRHWFKRYKLPMEHKLNLNGIKLVLAHGHISMWHWFWNYVRLFLTFRIHDNVFFQRQLARLYPEADLIVYGHLHFQYDEVTDGIRFLNPGSGYPHWRNKGRPQYMMLTVKEDGELVVERREVILN